VPPCRADGLVHHADQQVVGVPATELGGGAAEAGAETPGLKGKLPNNTSATNNASTVNLRVLFL